MSNNKTKKRVYSKPVVEKPEEVIEEQTEVQTGVNAEVQTEIDTEEIIEAKPIDPEVFERKLFVEEQPETVPEELIIYHNIDAEAELTKMLEKEMAAEPQGIDAVEEFRKLVQAELEKEIDEEDLLIKQLATPEPEKIQVLPNGSLALKYGEDYHPDPNVERTLVDKSPAAAIFDSVAPTSEEQPNQGCIDTLPLEPMYTLTPEQEEEGAKAIAEMVNNSILEDLKALASEPKIHGEYFFTEKQAHEEVKALSPEHSKDKTLDTLSQHDLRHFHRTGQMPK